MTRSRHSFGKQPATSPLVILSEAKDLALADPRFFAAAAAQNDGRFLSSEAKDPVSPSTVILGEAKDFGCVGAGFFPACGGSE